MEKTQERPILFKSEMVRAILSGNKTMTRRVVSPQPVDHHWKYLPGYRLDSRLIETTKGLHVKFTPLLDGRPDEHLWVKAPCGSLGDALWVKENCRFHSKYDNTPPSKIPVGEMLSYCADEGEKVCFQGKIRPSIFMLRWASRITLEITNVRVERLQDISEEDATREEIADDMCCSFPPVDHRDGFINIWEEINGKPRKDGTDISWSANPFVFVIEFKKVQG